MISRARCARIYVRIYTYDIRTGASPYRISGMQSLPPSCRKPRFIIS